MAPPPVFLPQQDAILDRFDRLEAKFDILFDLIKQTRRKPSPIAPPTAPLPTAPLPSAPLPAPQPSAPPAPKLPQIPAPVPARSYPPAPSVEALEEVENIQVKKLLWNIRKRPMRQKHRAAEAMPKKSCDAEFFVFGNCIAWPPKFGGINMRFSRDEEPDAWYTTMLNAHANELATRALPIRA